MSLDQISYQSPTSSRHSSLTKFQLFYDDSNEFQINRPISARLRRFNRNSIPSLYSSSTSLANSPGSIKSAPHEYRYPSYPLINGGTAYEEVNGNSFDVLDPQQLFQIDTTAPEKTINRTISMPSVSDSFDGSSKHSSRKNSLVSSCKHPEFITRRRSISIPVTDHLTVTTDFNSSIETAENRDSSDEDDLDDCKRHHHRRGSVAIKFKNPQVIENQEEADKINDNVDDLKEGLQKYELR